MTMINRATREEAQKLQTSIQNKITTAKSFEEASQSYTNEIYKEYKDSIALVRLFATTPFGALPPQNQKFVRDLAKAKHVDHLLHDKTLVLSLLGSSGDKPEWNDRKKSAGHVGIPLVSANFIDAIPMISRLLKQLGLGLDWIDNKDTEIVKQTMGSMSGVFFVSDATQESDHQNRKVIAAQDFVREHKIKSVFGFGGGYLGTTTFSVTILFLRDTLKEVDAKQFALGMSFFKSKTKDLVKSKIFA